MRSKEKNINSNMLVSNSDKKIKIIKKKFYNDSNDTGKDKISDNNQ